MNEKEYILAICIPTYNRPALLEIVKRYISATDPRFCVYISDNCSNDGTYEKLQALAENNKQLILHRNETNLGFRENYFASMTNAPAKYVIFSIDRDGIDIDRLSFFIDLLQSESPACGFVPYGYQGETAIHRYTKGKDAICNCAFLNRHPSGYFYNKELFAKEMAMDIYKHLYPSFAFPFDMAFCGICAEYDALVVEMPLVSLIDKAPSKTLSYNEDNIFFGMKMRLIAFNHYMERLTLTNLSDEDKVEIANFNLNKLLREVTLQLRNYYADPACAEHYNLKRRNIGYFEMMHNVYESMYTYVNIMKIVNIPFSRMHLFVSYNHRALSLAKAQIKTLIK